MNEILARAGPRSLVAALLSRLATTGRCAICRQLAGHSRVVCPRCDAALRRHAVAVSRTLPFAGVDRCTAACLYTGAGRDLVRALKFGRRIALADVAADLIVKSGALAGPPGGPPRPVVVPVPADPWRRLIRGFDSAELIAAAVARHAQLPTTRLLKRHHSRRQVGRGRAERIADPPRITFNNARKPRGENHPGDVPAACILVDDVVTTGATIGACAHALRLAGVEQIDAVTFAARPEPGGRTKTSQTF